MRYECQDCGKWVKDKFIFGLAHFCLSPDERAQREMLLHSLRAQQMPLPEPRPFEGLICATPEDK